MILFRLTATGKSDTVEAIATHAATEGYAITLIPIDASGLVERVQVVW